MPQLLYYNATCEMAIANGHHSYQPPERLQQFESDLSTIMMFMATPNDVVLCTQKPDDDFISFWESVGMVMPQFKTAEELKNKANTLLPNPWGYSKAAIFNLKRMGVQNCNFPISLQEWKDEHRNFFSRKTSALFEQSLMKAELPSFCNTEHTPLIISDYDELEKLITESKTPMVIKSLWSSSGRGVVMIKEEQHKKTALIWAKGKIRHEGIVIVEVMMNKTADFSFQFNLTNDNNVQYIGINHFATDGSGKFDKELIGEPLIFNQLTSQGLLPEDWEHQCVATLSEEIKKMNWHTLYEGIMGFDAMIIKNIKGEIKVRCCVEINFRNNMGLINMALKQYFGEDARGWWKIEQFERGGWEKFYRMMREKHPATIVNGRIKSGFIPLTPSSEKMIYGVWGILE